MTHWRHDCPCRPCIARRAAFALAAVYRLEALADGAPDEESAGEALRLLAEAVADLLACEAMWAADLAPDDGSDLGDLRAPVAEVWGAEPLGPWLP